MIQKFTKFTYIKKSYDWPEPEIVKTAAEPSSSVQADTIYSLSVFLWLHKNTAYKITNVNEIYIV